MSTNSTQHCGDVHDLPDLSGYMVRSIKFIDERLSLISLCASLGDKSVFRELYVCLLNPRLAEANLACSPHFPALKSIAVRRDVQKLLAGQFISFSNELELIFQSQEKVSYIFDRGLYFISDRPLATP